MKEEKRKEKTKEGEFAQRIFVDQAKRSSWIPPKDLREYSQGILVDLAKGSPWIKTIDLWVPN